MKVKIPVGRNIFELECDNQENETELKSLGNELNKKVNKILSSYPDIDNNTAIVFASILAISESKEQIKQNSFTQKVENCYEQRDLFESDKIIIDKNFLESLLIRLSELEKEMELLRF